MKKNTALKIVTLLVIFAIPYFVFISYLNSSDFSKKSLKLASTYLSKRVGYPIQAESWNINPITFEASINDLTIQLDTILLHVSEASVQVSPLGFIIGRIQFSEIAFRNVTIAGKLPLSDKKKSSKNTADLNLGDVTSMITKLQSRLKKGRVAISKIRIEKANVSLSLVSGFVNYLEVEFLSRGQVKVALNSKQLTYKPLKLSFNSINSNLSILKNYRTKQTTLNVYNCDFNFDSSNQVSFSGAMPGKIKSSVKLNLLTLIKHLKSSKLASGLPATMTGTILSKLDFYFDLKKISNIEAVVETKDLHIDEFVPNNISFQVSSNELNTKNLKIKNLKIQLPNYPFREKVGHARQSLSSMEISLKENSLQGVLKADNLNICSIIFASGEPSCQSWGMLNGHLVLAGSVEPFQMVVAPHLIVTDGKVGNSSLSKKDSIEIFNYDKAVLLGKIIVDSEKVNLKNLNLKFKDQSKPMYLNGDILYSPSQVDLKLNLNDVEVLPKHSKLFSDAVNAKVGGFVNITYSKLIDRSKGRSIVTGNLNLKDFVFSEYSIGNLAGSFKYRAGVVELNSVKIKRRGGVVSLQALVDKDENSERQIQARVSFKKYPIVIDRTDELYFNSYLSGALDLKGPLNREKIKANMTANFSNVSLNKFTFDQVNMLLNWRNNKLQVKNGAIVKNNRKIIFNGDLFSDNSAVKISSVDYRLSDVDYLADNFEHINGVLKLQGELSEKKVSLEGKISNFVIAKKKIPEFNFNLLSDFLKYKANFSIKDQMNVFIRAQKSANKSEIELKYFKGIFQNNGNLIPFSLVNSELYNEKYTFEGTTDLEWSQHKGALKLNDLHLRKNLRTVLDMSGKKTLIWGAGGINSRNFTYDSKQFSIRTEKLRANKIKLKFDMPAEVVNLLVGNIVDVRKGDFTALGYLDYPLHIDHMTMVLDLSKVQAVERLSGTTVDNLAVEVSYSKNRVTVQRGRANVAKGLVEFNGVVDPWSNTMSTLNFSLDKFPIVYGSSASMELSGNMYIKGSNKPFFLGGNLLIDKANVALPSSGGGFSPTNKDPLLKFGLNLNLGSNFLIQDNIVNSKLLGKLFIWGNSVTPKIQGAINFSPGGRLNIKNHNFEINRGKIDFSNTTISNPYLDISGQATVEYTSDYLVNMRVFGAAEELKISLRSNPQLTEKEIIHLLAFSSLPGEEQLYLESTAQAEAFQQLFGNLLSRKLMDNTGFQVKIESKRELKGDSTLPKVTVVKKLSDKVTATFGRSLIADKPERDLKVDYRLHRNVGVTGVWENLEQNESSYGVDLRFRFNLK